MNRLVIALVLVVGCSGKGNHESTATRTGSGSGPAIYPKKVSLSWGIQPTGSTTAEVFLVATDETGKAVSYPLGTFTGTCQVIKPAPEMKAVTGVHCANGAKGTELHAVIQNDVVIILKMATDAGTTPDPMAREEATRFTMPPGAMVEAGS